MPISADLSPRECDSPCILHILMCILFRCHRGQDRGVEEGQVRCAGKQSHADPGLERQVAEHDRPAVPGKRERGRQGHRDFGRACQAGHGGGHPQTHKEPARLTRPLQVTIIFPALERLAHLCNCSLTEVDGINAACRHVGSMTCLACSESSCSLRYPKLSFWRK